MNVMKTVKALMAQVAFVGIALSAGSAHALLTIDPADNIGTLSQTSNCNAACMSAILGYTVFETYKMNAGDASDSGAQAANYTTTFAGGSDGKETATITWNGPGQYVCGGCILLVKDGNNTPNQIYFNLGPVGTNALSWNGTETIFISDPLIWPGSGSISHVSIFSTTDDGVCRVNCFPEIVPEPATLALVGVALLGIGAARRRKQ